MLLIVNWADIQRHHEKNGVSMKGLMCSLLLQFPSVHRVSINISSNLRPKTMETGFQKIVNTMSNLTNGVALSWGQQRVQIISDGRIRFTPRPSVVYWVWT